MSDYPVICEKVGRAGKILLNRPKALNALTLDMVRMIAAALDDWENDAQVACVLIEGAGDSFCAGGDIRALYEAGKAGDHKSQLDFWREEYTLNARINRYSKPFAALTQGVVMGGGVGLSMHASHRIAGDNYLWAMPEVGIGFFPDVGATYFLPRLSGVAGRYLALTGARLKRQDAIAIGIAQNYVPTARFGDLAKAICETGDIERALVNFAEAPGLSDLIVHYETIRACFGKETVAEILEALEADGSPFADATHEQIVKKSPTSLLIAMRQMRIGGDLDIEEALKTEFRIVSRICRGRDFYEGVRAAIIDKDKQPLWSPDSLESVAEDTIDDIFAMLDTGELELDRPNS